MSPLDVKGEAASIREDLKEAGEELQDPTLNDDQRNRAAAKVRRLERRIDRIEQSGSRTQDDGITDPTMRALRTDVRRLQDTVTKFVISKDPDLEKVQPYFEEILDENPALAEIEDSEQRLRAIKAIGEKRYREDHPDANDSSEDESRPSRAHRQGGGAPVMMRGRGPSLETLEKKLAEAKTPNERAAIIDAWNVAHPPS